MGTYSNADELASRVEDLKGDLEEAHDEGVESAMKDVEIEAVRRMIQNDSLVSGESALKLYTTPSARGADVGYSVVAPAPLGYLEYGTGIRGETGSSPAPSTKPPIKPILDWVKEKGITPQETGGPEALAFAIRNKIADKGTHPHPFLRPTWWTFGRDHVTDEVKKRRRKAVRNF